MENLRVNLSSILEWEIQIEKLEFHIETSDGGETAVDMGRTDMYFHAIDFETKTAISQQDIMRKIDDNSVEIQTLFSEFFVLEVRPVPVVHVESGMRVAEIALIIVAVIIFFGAVLGCGIMHFYHKKKSRKQTRPSIANYPQTHVNGGGPKNNKGSISSILQNPIFVDSTEFTSPDMEIDPEGNTVLVIDNEPPGPSSGGTESTWASPFHSSDSSSSEGDAKSSVTLPAEQIPVYMLDVEVSRL